MTDRNTLRYPTPEETTALIAAAHRARLRFIRLLFRLGVRAVKSRLAHLAMPAARRLSHA
ncbi:MAG TPA: hypothetical protein VLV56_12445 [Burkholderiales bacterium]|nr:hypothetical protein [Burkholderiales bacterium]